ncbi:MAG: CC0125/CC1285 family lipoprotein [Gammaproteobacteria bacterium]
MKYWAFHILTFVVITFAGCATFKPTPYQASIDGGYGYSDEQVGAGEYRITVSGNAATSAQMLWDQLLLRAAEITLASGHEYFVVAPNAAGQLVNIEPAYLMPQFGVGPAAGMGVRTPIVRYYRRDYGRPGVDYAYPIGVEPSRDLIATATIALIKKRQAGANNVFDAETLRERLAPKVVSP